MSYSFRYQAKNNQGETVRGELEAHDIETAKAALQQQGLVVENIHAQIWKSPSPTVATPAAPRQESGSAPAAASPANSRKWVPYLVGGVVIVALLIMFPLLARLQTDPTVASSNVPFTVVKFTDLSEGGTNRAGFFVSVERGVTKEDVKSVAQKIWRVEKQRLPNMSQAMFHFFYQEQDHATQNPIAVLRWNWNGSRTWETSFSFSRADAKEKINIERTGLVSNEYVKYKLTVSNNISLDGASTLADSEFERLESQWKGKVQSIKLVLIYENFDQPFMKCEKDVTANGVGKRPACEFVQ